MLVCGVTRSFCALFAELTGTLSAAGAAAGVAEVEAAAAGVPTGALTELDEEGIPTLLSPVTARTLATSAELEEPANAEQIYIILRGDNHGATAAIIRSTNVFKQNFWPSKQKRQSISFSHCFSPSLFLFLFSFSSLVKPLTHIECLF